MQKHTAQGRKAASAGGPIGTKSGGSITAKSGGPIQTKFRWIQSYEILPWIYVAGCASTDGLIHHSDGVAQGTYG